MSSVFHDVYYSSVNGLEESQYIFLQHNRLQERWSTFEDVPGAVFTLGETGFGTGLNFLAAWSLWRGFGFRHARLHYVSVEKYPLTSDTLARAHSAWPALAELSRQLCGALPLPYPGLHRRAFDGGLVTLTLLHGDAAECLEGYHASVDAWFLDGFTPSRNPDLWTPRVFRAVAALSHAGTTFATFTSASQVRRDLTDVGFVVSKAEGFGPKREMCFGTRTESSPPTPCTEASPDTAPWFRHLPVQKPTSVIVIGAGLAGCAMAASLAQRSLTVTVLDQAPQIASAASGNPIGLTFVRLTAHDSPQNRYYLMAYLHALARIRQALEAAGIAEGEHWRLNGILRVFDDEAEAAEVASFLETPHSHWLAQPLGSNALSALAGFAIDRPGMLQPGSGWLNPATLCRALLASPLIETHLNAEATALEIDRQGQWTVQTPVGIYTADAVVIANSTAAARFAQTAHLTLRTVRGQITRLSPSDESRSLQHALNYSGYVTPAWQGFHTVGATFHPKRQDTEESAADHAHNLAALRNALPGFPALANAEEESPGGRVAFRTGTPDYLPYVGPAPDADAYRAAYQDALGKGQLKRNFPLGPQHPRLYVNAGHGSRGITSSLLAAEVICHWMLGEPAPVDTETLQALHPARFLIRHFKRRKPA